MFVDEQGRVRKPVAYLADYEMFLPTYPETVKYWHHTCDRYGIVGYYPGGAPGPNKDYSDNPKEMWLDIRNTDINGVTTCDFVIAQLDGWRGPQPDSGTAFEVGYAIGLGKPVYGFFTGEKEMIQRAGIIHEEENSQYYDQQGYGVENQGYPLDNIFRLVKIADSFEAACQLARKDFDEQLQQKGYHPYKLVY